MNNPSQEAVRIVENFWETGHGQAVATRMGEHYKEALSRMFIDMLTTFAHTIREEEFEKYDDIFAWLLGEHGEFPDLSQKPHYRFRTELRERIKHLRPTTNHTGETDTREDKCRCGKRVAHPHSNVVCSNFPNCSDDKTNP